MSAHEEGLVLEEATVLATAMQSRLWLSSRAAASLLIFGLVGLTLGDRLHLIAGAICYACANGGPGPGGQPAWVPLLMGTSCVAAGQARGLFRYLIRGDAARSQGSLVPAGLGLGLYGASGFLGPAGGVGDLLIAAAALAIWSCFDRSWTGIAFATGLAIVGSGVEIALVHLGIFHYEPGFANFFGVPSSLPWLYLACGTALHVADPR